MKCKTRNCPNEAKALGLCASCYNSIDDMYSHHDYDKRAGRMKFTANKGSNVMREK